MKRILFFLVSALLSFTSYCQENDESIPRIIKDTLFTTNGYNIIQGQDVKIGTGSMVDGDFKFIRINTASLFAYTSTSGYQNQANSANAFPRSQSGLKYKIKKLEKRGNKKHGYVYYAKIGTGLVNYEIDVENAIASGELNVPEEYRTKKGGTTVEVKNQLSVADELTKLKKLLDDGILTKEEYETQKKKLLEKN